MSRDDPMDLGPWLGFVVASLVVAAIPGPGVASIVGFAFSAGRKAALASVAGMVLGNAMAVSISLAGAGAILASSPAAFSVLKWAGALYLVTIGSLAIARAGGPIDGMTTGRAVGARTAFLTNVAVGAFHPKTILFFVAFASQFIRADRPYVSQAANLGGTFVLIAMTTDTLYALTAAKAAGLIRRPTLMKWSRRAGGGAVVTAGVVMAVMTR